MSDTSSLDTAAIRARPNSVWVPILCDAVDELRAERDQWRDVLDADHPESVFTEREQLAAENARLRAVIAEAWYQGFEAGTEYATAYTWGNNGPPDPPLNPYQALWKES